MRYYQNPIRKKGDFADPFVLRYNGKYYLYATNPDIRCFTSKDLVNWKLEGPVIKEDTFPGLVPFAPEVVYADGKFYMYTSPSGFGHYVLESDSPLGPFKKISGNQGHAIDGSVFIDDDGKWYFYWAGDEGIWGCEMKSPTEFGEPVLTGAYLKGWTEGPAVIKRDGIYYMTYTGNHYLSKGYRIQTAWSREPLKGFQDEGYNPAVIHTQGKGVGLGHSSTVLGPDLASWYLVYHNLNPDASRDLNIDRILWEKGCTQVLGPTREPFFAPALPDESFPEIEKGKGFAWREPGFSKREEGDLFYILKKGGELLGKSRFFGDFTGEVNLLIPKENENCGVLLEGKGGRKYYLRFLGKEKKIQFLETWRGTENVLKEKFMERIQLQEVLQNVRLEVGGGKISVFVAGRLTVMETIEKDGYSLGYFSEREEVGIGYMAVSRITKEREEILPSEISFMPVCGAGAGEKCWNGELLLREKKSRSYQILIQDTGEYDIYFSAKRAGERKNKLQISFGGQSGVLKELEGLKKITLRAEKGVQRLTLYGLEGETLLRRIELRKARKRKANCGDCRLEAGPYGKDLLTGVELDDASIEVEFSGKILEKGGSFGVLLRVSEPSEGGEGEDQVLGIDFFKGYSVTVGEQELRISRHSYDRKLLAKTSFKSGAKEERSRLCIEIRGEQILVFDKEGGLLLKAGDPRPFARGGVGVWAEKSSVKLEGIRIKE